MGSTFYESMFRSAVTKKEINEMSGPVNSPHKGPVTRKMLPFDDVII